MIQNSEINKLKSLNTYKENKFLSLLGIFLIVFIIFVTFFSAPYKFPVNHIVEIEEGSSLNEIADLLKEEQVIRSTFLFKLLSYASLNQKDLFAGDYFFGKKLNTFFVLGRIANGKYGIDPVLVTVPEGSTILEISEIFSSRFEDFDKERFLRLAIEKEGFLFPDTYNFLPNVKADEVVLSLERNFNEKIKELAPLIEESGHSLNDIVTMASILEEEARTTESREIIAGILWKRIEIGMPLQVDAVFPYIIGKNTFELTLDDLDFDSPYNTYKYKGLPPGPITNPGLDSIKATLNPVESDYLFYLSDMGGMMHYAEDFEGHKKNKFLYLN